MVNSIAILKIVQIILNNKLSKKNLEILVNFSSKAGSINLNNQGNAYMYRASKTALNAYTIHLALELKDTKIKVNSGHPGWVKTELGGPNAPVEVKDSYKTSLYLATLSEDGPSGGLFHGEDIIPW